MTPPWIRRQPESGIPRLQPWGGFKTSANNGAGARRCPECKRIENAAYRARRKITTGRQLSGLSEKERQVLRLLEQQGQTKEKKSRDDPA